MNSDDALPNQRLIHRGIVERWAWQPEHYEYVMGVIAQGLKAKNISQREKQGWVKCFLATVQQNLADEQHRRDSLVQGRDRVALLLQRIATEEGTTISEPSGNAEVEKLLTLVEHTGNSEGIKAEEIE